jgi:hypothetical protein
MFGPFARGRDPLCGSCALVRLLRGFQAFALIAGVVMIVMSLFAGEFLATAIAAVATLTLISITERALRAEQRGPLP